MEIRRLPVSENNDTRPLYEEVFSEDSSAFVDYYYTEKTRDNTIYAAEEDGGIQAMLHLNPYRLLVNGEEKDAHYIVAVATREAYRKRGYMAALMRRALRDMYEAGETFTYLMPAAEAIYLPHDFRTVYEQEKRYYDRDEKPGGGTEIRPASEADCAELAEAAGAWLAERYQIYVKRDEAYYRRLIRECGSDGGEFMIYRKGGRIADCRIYFPSEAEEDARKPLIMARIVDVRRMLMSMGLKTLTAACFTVTDPVIRENNRCVVITGTEYSGVMVMDGEERNSEGTITIAALTSLLFGAKSAEEICAEEGAAMSERLRGELGKIVPLSNIYLNEEV